MTTTSSTAYRLIPLPDHDGSTTPAGPVPESVGTGAQFGLLRSSRPVPELGPQQILVHVRATALNRRDLMLVDGTYPLPAVPGVVPLADGVGEVIAVGEQVTRFAVGERVASTYFLHWVDGPQRIAQVREQFGANHDGWLAEHIVLDEDSAVLVPDHLTDAEAATLTCTGLVAWSALTTPVPVAADQTVLTVGTGAAALFAIQFARMHGARVISVTSGPAKAQRLRELGADETVDRSVTPDWEHAVLELTGGDGADHIVDCVGMPTLPKSVAAAAFNAQITQIGAFAGSTPTLNPFDGKYVSIRRIAVGSRTAYEAMNTAIATHGLRPVIDRVFPFEAAPAAYRYYRDGNPFGKVVIAR